MRRAAILPLAVAGAAFFLYVLCLAPLIATGGHNCELGAAHLAFTQGTEYSVEFYRAHKLLAR